MATGVSFDVLTVRITDGSELGILQRPSSSFPSARSSGIEARLPNQILPLLSTSKALFRCISQDSQVSDTESLNLATC